jgi:DNA-binding LacI/PurR family transcriptional regulator
MGRRAADLLIEAIAAKRTQRSKKVLIEPKLVIRRSTERSNS